MREAYRARGAPPANPTASLRSPGAPHWSPGCIECGASALSIAEILLRYALTSASPPPLPDSPNPRLVVRFSRAEEREQLPRTEKIVVPTGREGEDSIDRGAMDAAEKLTSLKNVNIAPHDYYAGRQDRYKSRMLNKRDTYIYIYVCVYV